MITSVRRLIGMPVVFREKELGYVEQAYAGEGKLEGVVIRRGMGSARWLAAEEMMMKHDHLIASRKPADLPKLCRKRAERVCMENGQYAGEVSDWILLDGNLRFAAVEVSPGPIYRLLGRCGYACEFHRDQPSGSVIVPRLLSWSQLKRQLGEEDDR